jgi:hypothetical protein
MRITIPFDEDAKVYLILMFKTIQGTPIYGSKLFFFRKISMGRMVKSQFSKISHCFHGEIPNFWYLQWSRISAESFDHLHCHLGGEIGLGDIQQ